LKNLVLRRPLVVFDLETTGVDPATDRIVEISALRIEPDGRRESKTRRINPERPIPPGATAVHGIRDEDVRDEPPFRKIASGLLDFLEGADLAGFNVRRFDIPMLENEFRACSMDLGLSGRKIVDAMTIFHRMEPRDLSAAVRYYLGREHVGAHGAEADVAATAEILDAQLDRYEELPRAVDDLERWMHRAPEGSVDRSGKFAWKGDEIVFAFGKNQGRALREVVLKDRGYCEWIVRSDFPEDAKGLVRDALGGNLPRRREG
jgi:DNA polymerase-3 subunit epsilon